MTSVSICIDEVGAFAVVTFARLVQVGDARKHATTLFHQLPEPQQKLVLSKLRPLDELDLDRATAMRTITDCRPNFDPPEKPKPRFAYTPPQESEKRSYAALLAKYLESDDE